MQIQWHNIIAFILAIVAMIILVKNGPAINAFLSAMGQIGPGYSRDEQTMGLIAFGLILAAIAALVKIVVESNRKD